jgi:glutamine synthetase type III
MSLGGLEVMSTHVYDDATMLSGVGQAVFDRFKDALVTGAPTSETDQQIIAADMFKWAKGKGAIGFAHWFFPMRNGSGAVGGSCGALKQDAFIDLVWSSKESIKPFEPCFPPERCATVRGSVWMSSGCPPSCPR